ncbi:MAG: hypothetical protein R2771_11355 [Saprospiraceae bacterium]
MKRIIIFLSVMFLCSFIVLSGRGSYSDEVAVVKDKPVRSPYETSTLVDFPTTLIPAKGSYQIQ